MNCSLFAENTSSDEDEAQQEEQAPTYERYRSIVDRAPFGVPPPDFNPQAIPGSPATGGVGGEAGGMTAEEISQEAQRLISEVQVSVLSFTPNGNTMVGFTDKVNQRNYYLKVGSDKDGWKVVSADRSAQSVVLSKDGVEATIQVGASSDSNKDGKKKARPMRSPMSRNMEHTPVPAVESQEVTPPSPSRHKGLLGGAMSRLRERRMAERKERMEADRLRREKEEHDKKETQQLREKLTAMEEKAEQDAIDREQSRAQLQELSEMLKRNREKQQSAEGEGQGVPEGGE
jgi:hypothetical protein